MCVVVTIELALQDARQFKEYLQDHKEYQYPTDTLEHLAVIESIIAQLETSIEQFDDGFYSPSYNPEHF
jgi:hypothetical protein